jgi:hypothetical protein
MTSDRRVVNRRLVNLLSTAKLYIDQLQHDVSKTYGRNSNPYIGIKQFLAQEYDGSLGYRVMEAVRDHTQHRDTPVKFIHYSTTRVETCAPPMLRFSAGASLDYHSLQDDPKFEKSVLDELRPLVSKGRWIEVAPLVREHVQSIGRIHHRVRELIASDLSAADALMEEVLDRAKAAAQGESLAGLSIVQRGEDGRSYDSEWVSTELIERRKALQKKNSHLDSLARRFVSSIDGPTSDR